MTISYSTQKTISTTDVQRLLRQTSWANNRNLDDLQYMLDHSLAIGAWQGEALVGFARVVTDGRFRAFIEDVVVDEAYRKQGVGAGLIQAMLDELEGVEEVALFCEDHLLEFYGQFGFEKIHHNALHIWRGG